MAKSNTTATVLAVVVSLVVGGIGGYMVGGRTGQAESQAVATVNGEKITQKQLYDRMVTSAGPDALDRMITVKLVAQEAKKAGVTVSDADITAELNKIKDSLGGDQAYQQALASNQLTEDQLRESIVVQLSATKILGKDVKVEEADLEKFFNENQTQFDKRQIHARHILVATEAEANEIKAKLDGGADFATLAKEKSTEPGAKESGGDLGTFGRGKMLAEFDNVAFSLKKDEISKPVQTQYGWHVIQVLETKGEGPNFATMKDDVKQKYIESKVSAQFTEWLAGIKDKATITNTLQK